MNKLARNTMLLMFALSLGCSAIAYADDVAMAKADHMADAGTIEKQIAEQSVLISFHKKMRDDAPVKYFAREKALWGPTATSKVREMNMHCDAIINSAKRLKDELTGFANWHKEQVNASQS